MRRIDIGSAAQEPDRKNTAEWPILKRQAIALLALVLAFLQYYYFDVELQILNLRSLIVALLR